MVAKKPASIDEYITGFPKETREVLEQMRAIVRSEAPQAEETISYAIPTFKINNNYLVYFAGYKNHVSMYPAPAGSAAFEKEMNVYRSGRSTVQFPLDQPLPVELIKKIVKYRIRENLKKAK